MKSFSEKTIYILLSVILFLILVVSFPQWKEILIPEEGGKYDKVLGLNDFSKDKVDQFAIKNGEDKKIFVKENGVWFLNDKEAKEAEIDSFFEALSSLKVTSLVSENADNQDFYQLNEDEGYLLTFIRGKKIEEFLVGTVGNSLGTFYVKEKEAEEVYLAKGELRNKLVRGEEAWIVENLEEE